MFLLVDITAYRGIERYRSRCQCCKHLEQSPTSNSPSYQPPARTVSNLLIVESNLIVSTIAPAVQGHWGVVNMLLSVCELWIWQRRVLQKAWFCWHWSQQESLNWFQREQNQSPLWKLQYFPQHSLSLKSNQPRIFLVLNVHSFNLLYHREALRTIHNITSVFGKHCLSFKPPFQSEKHGRRS